MYVSETSSSLNFTAGDRCLVHLLESEAGQLLNGQHVNLIDGIIREGRFRCRFEDGTIRKCIKYYKSKYFYF